MLSNINGVVSHATFSKLFVFELRQSISIRPITAHILSRTVQFLNCIFCRALHSKPPRLAVINVTTKYVWCYDFLSAQWICCQQSHARKEGRTLFAGRYVGGRFAVVCVCVCVCLCACVLFCWFCLRQQPRSKAALRRRKAF